MSITYYNSVLSTSSSSQPLFSNPIGEGSLDCYLNYTGSNLMSAFGVVDNGTINYSITSGNVFQSGGTNTLTIPLSDTTNIYIDYTFNSSSDNGFSIRSDNNQVNVGVNAEWTAKNYTGTVTGNNTYNSSGLLLNNKSWVGSTTTNSSGAFSIDISSAGFNSVASAQVTAVDNTTAALTVPLASLKTVSTSTITGNVVEGTTVPAIVGGASLAFVGAGITVYATVNGQ